jgi:hypothetical protein
VIELPGDVRQIQFRETVSDIGANTSVVDLLREISLKLDLLIELQETNLWRGSERKYWSKVFDINTNQFRIPINPPARSIVITTDKKMSIWFNSRDSEEHVIEASESPYIESDIPDGLLIQDIYISTDAYNDPTVKILWRG